MTLVRHPWFWICGLLIAVMAAFLTTKGMGVVGTPTEGFNKDACKSDTALISFVHKQIAPNFPEPSVVQFETDTVKRGNYSSWYVYGTVTYFFEGELKGPRNYWVTGKCWPGKSAEVHILEVDSGPKWHIALSR